MAKVACIQWVQRTHRSKGVSRAWNTDHTAPTMFKTGSEVVLSCLHWPKMGQFLPFQQENIQLTICITFASPHSSLTVWHATATGLRLKSQRAGVRLGYQRRPLSPLPPTATFLYCLKCFPDVLISKSHSEPCDFASSGIANRIVTGLVRAAQRGGGRGRGRPKVHSGGCSLRATLWHGCQGSRHCKRACWSLGSVGNRWAVHC